MNTDSMTKARAGLIVSQPFFGSLALYLELVEGDTETMATDGKKLFYNPKWVEALPGKQRQGVIAHEVLHCAYKHHLRRQSRDAKLWNIAADYAINRDLIQAGFELPADGLFSNEFPGMGAEEIYARLQSKKQAQGQAGKPGDGNGQPGKPQAGGEGGSPASGQPGQGWGEVRDGSPEQGPESAQKAAQEAEWDRRVRSALAISARGIGGLPEGLQELLKEINKPKVDWRDQLQAFIDARSRTESTWKRPSRRSAGAGFFMPGTQPDNMTKLGVVLDVSGSVNTQLVEQFMGELQSILDNGITEELIAIQCDTRVTKIDEYRSGDLIDLTLNGRGGTRFSPALEWFRMHHPDVGALIYFTDLECTDYGPEPSCPMLWAAYGMESHLDHWIAKVPFGQVIKVVV